MFVSLSLGDKNGENFRIHMHFCLDFFMDDISGFDIDIILKCFVVFFVTLQCLVMSSEFELFSILHIFLCA
jgi:hypothetical protein